MCTSFLIAVSMSLLTISETSLEDERSLAIHGSIYDWSRIKSMSVVNKIGSSTMVLVDANDRVLGFKEKYATHKIPVPLHRAISIIIFNNKKDEMLITKRAAQKPTWPLFWTNAVCSHPYPEESYQAAAERRLYEELGFKTKIKEVYKFTYEAKMHNKVWGENELDHVFVGTFQGAVHPNPNEVAGYEWIKISDLKKDLKKNPNKYTPWFKIIIKKVNA